MFGLMSVAKHKREMTEARRTYRLAHEEELGRALSLQHEYEYKLNELVRARMLESRPGSPRLQMLITLDDIFTKLKPSRYDYERMAQRIITGLMGARDDYRPDMRQDYLAHDQGLEAGLTSARLAIPSHKAGLY